MFFLPKSFKRKFSGVMLAIYLFVGVGGSVFFPNPAQAQPSITLADIPRIAAQVILEALSQVGSAIQVTAAEVLTYLGQKVAHDMAVHLVAGGVGQRPLFSVKDGGQYIQDLVLDTAAESLASFGDNLAGVNICTFDPALSLNLKLGFIDTASILGQGPLAGKVAGRKCDFRQLKARFEKIQNEVSTFSNDPAKGFSARFQVQFQPNNNTLDGYANGLFTQVNAIQNQAKALTLRETWDRIGNIKAKTSRVDGSVITPKEINNEITAENLVRKPARIIESKLNAALQADAKQIVKIVALSAQVFVQTLLSEVTKKIFNGLAPKPKQELLNPFAGGSTGLIEAQQASRAILAVTSAAVDQYDSVGVYAACPTGQGIHRNPDNCVIDQQFATAIRRGQSEVPVTIQEAMDQGLLHKDWPLFGPNSGTNQSPDCYRQGYCYSNLVKLRRARVIPVGFEIAAQIAERERPGTTLQEVVNAFDGRTLPSFKHLLDPNWILKYPPTRCDKLVTGSTLLSDETPDRQEVCVDTPSCVTEDGKGNCPAQVYGYCMKEKNVWRLDGDACPAEMSSCLTFTRPGGAQTAYLTNSLDNSNCNSSNPGCWRYLLSTSPTPTLDAAAIPDATTTVGTGSSDILNVASAATFEVGKTIRIMPANSQATIIAKNAASTPNTLKLSGTVSWTSGLSVEELGFSNLIAESPTVTSTISGGAGTSQIVPLATVDGFIVGHWIRVNGMDARIDSIDDDLNQLHVTSTNGDPQQKGIAFTSNATVTQLKETTNGEPTSIYLNGQVTKCQSGDKGCTGVVDLTTANVPLNLIQNPDFSSDANADGVPDGWFMTDKTMYANDPSNASDGGAAVHLKSSATQPSQSVTLAPTHFYTLSFSIKPIGILPVTIIPQISYTNPTTGASVGTTETSSISILGLLGNRSYVRRVFTVTSPNQDTIATVSFKMSGIGEAWLDNVQLEESDQPSPFHTGYPTGTQQVFMKVPPLALGCTGLPGQDPACAQYAGVCSVRDIGCEKYTPTNGDPAVNGQISTPDLCPSACIGYDTFKQLGYDDAAVNGAGFEKEKFPVYFSPTSPAFGARSCSLQSVGCDEFTNLEATTAGGESRAFYAKIRRCQVASDGDDSSTFYTWEGSDVAGLQLKTWRLKKSDKDGGVAPCTNAAWDTSAGDGDLAVLKCNDTVTDTNLATEQATCQSHADATSPANPDCREFYDVAGGIHYRFLSKTVIASDQCVKLRKTTVAGGSVAAGSEGRANCVATGGRPNATTGDCVYFGLPSDSTQCTAAESGCRAYRGNAGSNTRLVYSENFETVQAQPSGAVPGWIGGTFSTESLAASGHSLKGVNILNAGNLSTGATPTLPLSGLIQPSTTYLVTFWAKAESPSATLQVTLVDDETLVADVGTVSLSTEWQRFSMNAVQTGPNAIALPNLDFARNTGSGSFFLDNVEVREVRDLVAYVKDSWTVPVQCDQTLAGAPSPQEMLGCREYKDRAGTSVALRSFSRQCPEGSVGCKAFMDTQNSDSTGGAVYNARCYANAAGTAVLTSTACTISVPGSTDPVFMCTVLTGQSFCRYNSDITMSLRPNATGASVPNTGVRAPDTVVVSRDSLRYLVDDPGKRCNVEARGCYEFGKAIYSQDQTNISSVGKVTLLNLPDRYGQILCGAESLFCDAFSGDDGAVRYFKDPEPKNVDGSPATPKLCDFRADVIVGDRHFNGWFKTGTTEGCYPDLLIAGTTYGLRKNADSAYAGWVGSCTTDQSKCTEFLDPTDRTAENPGGKSYFFLKNEKILNNTCNQASRRDACAMFDDTSIPTKSWNADVTYAVSDGAGGAPTTPIDCSTTNDPTCAKRCRLTFLDLNGESEPTRLITSQVCSRTNSGPIDSDCSGIEIPGKRIALAKCVDITNTSETANSVFADPRDEVAATATKPRNNANILISVRRDRECGEWYSCITSSPITDPITGQKKNVCNEIRACTSAISTASGATVCTHFAETGNQPFGASFYQGDARDVSWKGGDYSGYTVPGVFPLDKLGQVNVAGRCSVTDKACFAKSECPGSEACKPNVDDPDLRLAHPLGGGRCTGKSNGEACVVGHCKNNQNVLCTNASADEDGASDQCPGSECLYSQTLSGTCYDNQCVQMPGDASQFADPETYVQTYDVVLKQPEAASCRAYPEKDSPVPATVVSEWAKKALIGDVYLDSSDDRNMVETLQWHPLSVDTSFGGANVCLYAKTADGRKFRTCECRYSKVTYGNSDRVKYFPQGTKSRIRPYICASGQYDGAACNPSSDPAKDPCGPDGRCVALGKIDDAQGIEGYCLQHDLSVAINGDNGGTACAMWLPVDVLPGSVDIYNQDQGAGFVPPEDDLYYCAEGQGRSTPNGKATEQPYTSTFVDEIGGGIFCGEGPEPCASHISESTCEAGRDFFGLKTCKWSRANKKCQVVFIPGPELPAIAFPGCLPADGIPLRDGGSGTKAEFLTVNHCQNNDSKSCTNNDDCGGDGPCVGNECVAKCSLRPITIDRCIKFNSGGVEGTCPDCSIKLPSIEVNDLCGSGDKNHDGDGDANGSCRCRGGGDNEFEKVSIPVTPPLPNCDIRVANCCLPPLGSGGSDIVKGFITTVTNLNPTSYKVCGSKVATCPEPPGTSLVFDSCKDIDKMLIAIAAITTVAAAVALVVLYVLASYAYATYGISLYAAALLAPFFTVIFTMLGTAFAIVFARCAMLAADNVCTATPMPDRYIFSAPQTPLGTLTEGTPLSKLVGSNAGASGIRESPRNGALKIPTPSELIPFKSPIQGVIPKDLRKEEIAAIKITVDQDNIDDQTRGVPAQFFLMPPNFEASFWWNGGDKDDNNATKSGEALFFESYGVKCGDNGLNCKNLEKNLPADVTPNCEYFFDTTNNEQHCAKLVKDISPENEGIENCAAIKARFGKHCSNQPQIECRIDSECSWASGFFGNGEIPPPGTPLNGTCVGNEGEKFFLGFKSGMCIRSSTKGGNMPVKVELLLRETCNVIAQTARSSETSIVPQSIAYTDRLWDGHKPQYAIVQSPNDPSATYPLLSEGIANPMSDPFYPFGRLALKGNELRQVIPLYLKSGVPPVLPFTYLKKSDPEKPPLTVMLDTAGPVGGYAYSCPQDVPDRPRLIPNFELTRLLKGVLAFMVDWVAVKFTQIKDDIPLIGDAIPPPPLFGLYSKDPKVMCHTPVAGLPGGTDACGAPAQGRCGGTSAGIVCSNSSPDCDSQPQKICSIPPVDFHCDGDSNHAVCENDSQCIDTAHPNDTHVCGPVISGGCCALPCKIEGGEPKNCSLNDLQNLINQTEPRASRSCVNVTPKPLETSADGAKKLLGQIYAKSFGIFSWNGVDRYAPNGKYCSNDLSRTCSVTGDCIAGVSCDQRCDNDSSKVCTTATSTAVCGGAGLCGGTFLCSNNTAKSCSANNNLPATVASCVSCVDIPSPARAATASGAWDVRNPDLQKGTAAGLCVIVGGSGHCSTNGHACTTSGECALDSDTHEPLVYPIKIGSCRPDGKCFSDGALPNQITVNDRNDGTVAGTGIFSAKVNFYFLGDKNHMPVKRIVVDWGDKTDVSDLTITNGLYKNRVSLRADGTSGCDGDKNVCSNDAKKTCAKDVDCGFGATCTNSGFSRSERACLNDYMTLTHTYVCDDTEFLLGLNQTSTTALDHGKPFSNTAHQSCNFKPRVMIVDNWGWCNGKCADVRPGFQPDTDPFSDICMDGSGTDIPNQCNPGASEASQNNGLNPWASFGGIVEVRKQ